MLYSIKSFKILYKSFSQYHLQIKRKNVLISCNRLLSSDVWVKDITFSHLKEMEEKWKNIVNNYADKVSTNNLQKNEKKYILSMFPYPSGNLHLGHVRVYSISDAVSRFYHMKGYKVIHPMGWDAFGLPAENAAFETGQHPEKWTRNNIKIMKKQLQELGFGFDWQREICTCDPEYYKWTQFIFLKLFQHGLVYKQESIVNWDPVDKTVLANEQVDENGHAWRSGAKVEKKPFSQWFIKCKKFSKELYDDLEDSSFENWKDVFGQQKAWIGDCGGYIIEMKMIKGDNTEYIKSFDHLSVWMKEPEYLESIGFLGIRSDHILNRGEYKNQNDVQSPLLNIQAIDPVFKRKIPIVVVSDDTLKEVVSEFYVGIPHLLEKDRNLCHDLNIPMPSPPTISSSNLSKREQIVSKLKDLNSGGYESSAILKDWLISRQRYWGTPIPIIYCLDCGIVPVAEEELPVKLPYTDSNISIDHLVLKDAHEWRKCSCPRCGKPAERETDTMDTFVDSSWYFLRYLDPNNDKQLISMDKAEELMPVDLYIGGKEHAILHLYFARFMHKFLTKVGLAKHKEPFKELLMQGIVKGDSYQVKNTGKYLRQEEIDFSVSPPVEKNTKAPLLIKPEKMSKSKFNGVNPQDLIDEFGIDPLRLAMLSVTSPHSDKIWSKEDMTEMLNFLFKPWLATKTFVLTRKDEKFRGVAAKYASEKDADHERLLFESRNKILLMSSQDFEVKKQFHLIVYNIITLINIFWSVPKHLILTDEYEKCLRCCLLLLSPFCPHITSELWQRVNEVSSLPKHEQVEFIFDAPWPVADPNYERALVCKVNNEEKCTIRIPNTEYSTLTQEKVEKLAYENEVLSSMFKDSPVLSVEFDHNPEFISTLNLFTVTMEELKKIEDKKQKEWIEKNKKVNEIKKKKKGSNQNEEKRKKKCKEN